MSEKAKPVFHRRIFWDVNFDQLDYDAKASFVIERVFERGDVDDVRNCRRYYGDEKVTSVLLNVKYFSARVLSYVVAVTGKNETEFASYHNRLPDRLKGPKHERDFCMRQFENTNLHK